MKRANAMNMTTTQDLDTGLDEATALSAATCLFRSLGEPARLAIVRHLAVGEHKVVELTRHLGLASRRCRRTWPA